MLVPNANAVTTRRATTTIRKAARRLGISDGLAYAAAHSGELPTIKIGKRLLVPIAALDRLLDGKPAA